STLISLMRIIIIIIIKKNNPECAFLAFSQQQLAQRLGKWRLSPCPHPFPLLTIVRTISPSTRLS
ncbi:MAG: hypothetical protein VW842_07620, partial [Halieaceae bacterium]